MAKQTIGEFLATQRKAKGYTQQYVADMLGISNRTLSAWETNKAYPDILTLPALAELYGVTADEIINGERSANATIKETELSEKSQAKLYKNKFVRNNPKFITLLSVGICAAVAFFLGICLTALSQWAITLVATGLLAIIAVITLIICFIKGVLASFSEDEELTAADKNYILCVINQYIKISFVIGIVWLVCGVIFFIPSMITIIATIYLIILLITAAIIVALFIAVSCYKIKILKKYGTSEQFSKCRHNAKLFALSLLCLLPLCVYIALIIASNLVIVDGSYFELPVYAHAICAAASVAAIVAGVTTIFIKRQKYKISI